MIKIHISFPSKCLGRDAEVKVLLPNPDKYDKEQRFPTLYLLHGLNDCADTWLSRTCLERYCDDHRLAVVLPTANRSFYCDMIYGDAYFTHVGQEIPEICEAMLPLVPDDAHRYIAGNSMGGYGAYKIALKHPGKFAKVAALSGVMDINAMIHDFPECERDWQLCFGGSMAPEQEDILKLLSKAEIYPEMYQYCGTADFLAEGNRRFCRLCEELKIPLTSIWEENGIHGWCCWEQQLPHMLDWLDREIK